MQCYTFSRISSSKKCLLIVFQRPHPLGSVDSGREKRIFCEKSLLCSLWQKAEQHKFLSFSFKWQRVYIKNVFQSWMCPIKSQHGLNHCFSCNKIYGGIWCISVHLDKKKAKYRYWLWQPDVLFIFGLVKVIKWKLKSDYVLFIHNFRKMTHIHLVNKNDKNLYILYRTL